MNNQLKQILRVETKPRCASENQWMMLKWITSLCAARHQYRSAAGSMTTLSRSQSQSPIKKKKNNIVFTSSGCFSTCPDSSQSTCCFYPIARLGALFFSYSSSLPIIQRESTHIERIVMPNTSWNDTRSLLPTPSRERLPPGITTFHGCPERDFERGKETLAVTSRSRRRRLIELSISPKKCWSPAEYK